MSRTLLSVDVEAAIRKLTDSQLSRSEMRPVELARALFGAGARALHLRSEPRGFSAEAPGASVSASLMELLVTTMSPEHPSSQRYSALLELEARGGLVWLALATDDGFELASRDAHGRWMAVLGPAERSLTRVGEGGAEHCRVSLRTRKRWRNAPLLIERHLRYARLPVELDGQSLHDRTARVASALAGPVRGDGFEGWVRIGTSQDYSCLRWIDREVLRAERYSQLAGGVAHDAVIHSREHYEECGAVSAVRDFRESTVAGAWRRFAELDGAFRDEVRHIIFSRAIERRDLAVLGSAPLFTTVGGEALNVAALRARAIRAPLEVTGLDPRPGEGENAIRLDALGRRLVTELLGLPIVGRAALADAGGAEKALRAIRDAWRTSHELLATQWSRWSQGRRIPDAALRDDELQFKRRLQGLLRGGAYRAPPLEPRSSRLARVEFVPRGRLPIRALPGEPARLRIPRADPTVQRVIRAHQRDPMLIYPALDVLFAGRDGWGARRSTWRRVWLEGS